jgi:hypothetical protein
MKRSVAENVYMYVAELRRSVTEEGADVRK